MDDDSCGEIPPKPRSAGGFVVDVSCGSIFRTAGKLKVRRGGGFTSVDWVLLPATELFLGGQVFFSEDFVVLRGVRVEG